jgi:hypothetical protein
MTQFFLQPCLQGTFDEGEKIYTADEGPAFMKDLADMTNFGTGNEQGPMSQNSLRL